MKLSERQLQALANLASSPDFQLVLDLIRTDLAESRQVLETAEVPLLLHRSQGRVAVCSELLEQFDNARDNLNRVRRT
ncbi:TPA: hypothetical protein ACID4M_003358 [Pseudomonas aeruginosa]